MVKTKEEALKYIKKEERKKVAYCKVGDSAKKLVLHFASNNHTGFERKTSLMELKYQRNDFDVMYLRNRRRWYLGKLVGIGSDIDDTIKFLQKEFSKYDKVVCSGASSGGYASLLFGSLLGVDAVVAYQPQIDLEYVEEHLGNYYVHLKKKKAKCPDTWNEYNNISELLNKNVLYYVFSKGDANCTTSSRDPFTHGDHHYNLIKDFPNVFKLKERDDVFSKIVECIG